MMEERRASSSARFALADRLNGLDKPTVWHEFSPLAAAHGSVNLGQGYPDWDPPEFVLRSMDRAVRDRRANQYARSYAHLPLARALAAEYAGRLGRDVCAETEVATAVGCTNALYCALQALLNPGDEAILLEPYFDIYSSQVQMAGGVPVYVPLRETKGNEGEGANEGGTGASEPRFRDASSFFALGLDELEGAVTDRTRVLLLNSPHNPTGKVFTRSELEGIADIVRRHPRLVVISDEVYEHLVYDPDRYPHVSMAEVLWDQTLTLSSAGKTFSATGWKVGWAVGPNHLVNAVIAVQQWVNFSAPTPNQDAFAQALEVAAQPYEGHATYYSYLVEEYRRKRELLIRCLRAAGMTPIVSPGGFFILADTSHIPDPPPEFLRPTPASPDPMPRDWALCRWLTVEVGVTAIPPSAFYSPEHAGLARNYLRFAFCKSDDTIRAAQARFEQYFGQKSIE
jgi:aspartate/methionine/tyrosine aminotransferase